MLKETAKENGVPADQMDVDHLVDNVKLKDITLSQLQNTGRKAGLAGFEIVEGVVLVKEVWEPENVSDAIYSSMPA